MNGHPRDQISTDLGAGRPTISPIADRLAGQVVDLMSGTEVAKLFNGLEYRVRRSPAFSDWASSPTRYLSEFDPVTSAAIEEHLAVLRARMSKRAKARGWEVEGGPVPRDISVAD